MGELTMFTLCETLANLTQNRCHLIENSNTCRCIGDVIHPVSSTVVVNKPPEIMLSEVFLIFFVLAIWLSAIGFCLNQYKSLRRLETQVHYCVNRKDPLNIGDIKIVAREQDSIIYKKKRYSTLLETHMNSRELKTMHYVQQYLPKHSSISALVIDRDDLVNNIPLSTITKFNSTNNISFNTHKQTSLSHFQTDIDGTYLPSIHRTGSARYTTGLTVPHISTSSSVHSSWHDQTSSAQHLSLPMNSLGSNCYSTGNISLAVPQVNPQTSDEQLLDPRLISATVRRSLLALHRESQENVNLLKKRDKTRSETDVHKVFPSSKTKIKSKIKRSPNQSYRPHSNTLSILPLRTNSNDNDRRLLEYIPMQRENFSPPFNSKIRRSLKHFPKYSTQSTSESETTQDLPLITNIYLPTDDDKLSQTIIETTEKTC